MVFSSRLRYYVTEAILNPISSLAGVAYTLKDYYVLLLVVVPKYTGSPLILPQLMAGDSPPPVLSSTGVAFSILYPLIMGVYSSTFLYTLLRL